MACTSSNIQSESFVSLQITVYHFTTNDQEKALDAWLQNAYLPALHKLNKAKIGAFKPIANDTSVDKLIYLIIPLENNDAFFSLPTKIQKDAQYLQASMYFDTSYKSPPFSRMEKILLEAFSKAPTLQLPKLSGPREERVYELRSYESPSESYYRNKVHMFNEGGETKIFTRLNFNPVFYAEVLAGSRMPNLMYLTCFENMADRIAHWKAFSADADWKKLSSSPFYQHNVSKTDIRFLKATNYSDY